ncbi:hypothetical protein PIB30_102164 [Stylosanthes scabra]|uniref:Uncharacterized protein n=1 Tax=Stylosanthes scabra TaxID=79078 RepID=A0ABU6UYS9_9FABA|nr:hypothetical protein [Stylosanthes scabra]
MKKYQMSAVTMGSGGSGSSTQPPPPPPYEPDQALMKIREQHATFTEICRQLKDWTRNASSRESYMISGTLMILLIIFRKNEERKLAEQETKFGSKAEEELHAYAWKSTHMRATQGLLRICVGSQQLTFQSHV